MTTTAYICLALAFAILNIMIAIGGSRSTLPTRKCAAIGGAMVLYCDRDQRGKSR